MLLSLSSQVQRLTVVPSMEQKDLWEMTQLTQMRLHAEPQLLVTPLGILGAASLL